MGFIFIGISLILFFFVFKQELSGGTGSGILSLSGIVKLKIFKYGLNQALVMAVIKVESGGNSKAINLDDPSFGLMQITPILAQTYGYITNYKNPTQNDIAVMMNVNNNSEIGCRFLSYLIKKYPKETAIQMYNLGETAYLAGKRSSEYLRKVIHWEDTYRSTWGSPSWADQEFDIY